MAVLHLELYTLRFHDYVLYVELFLQDSLHNLEYMAKHILKTSNKLPKYETLAQNIILNYKTEPVQFWNVKESLQMSIKNVTIS